ncbi:hypothetical protein [Vreelandella utahensis]|uniref:hypothetical protein n=1 Tax=Vreelandella halophila TaxID=86177 RepID=UPI000986AB32|nr:hypothetical protein [Halomonas utahensis]
MLVTYISRHGWRHTVKALLNTLLVFVILLQLGTMLAISNNRDFFLSVNGESSNPAQHTIGAWISDVLLTPVSTWVLMGFLVIITLKELIPASLKTRLGVNLATLLITTALLTLALPALYQI